MRQLSYTFSPFSIQHIQLHLNGIRIRINVDPHGACTLQLPQTRLCKGQQTMSLSCHSEIQAMKFISSSCKSSKNKDYEEDGTPITLMQHAPHQLLLVFSVKVANQVARKALQPSSQSDRHNRTRSRLALESKCPIASYSVEPEDIELVPRQAKR